MSLSRTVITIIALALAATSVEAMSSRQTCKYRGNVYLDNERVVGSTLTCTCSGERWVNCQANVVADSLEHVVADSPEYDMSIGSVPSTKESIRDVAGVEGAISGLIGAQVGFDAFLNNFDAEDFVIDFATQPLESTGLGGTSQPANRNNVPVIQASNMAQTRFRIAPCGINLPHVHPRGTESVYIIEGALTVGFVTEGGRLILNDVKTDQSTFFPQGLLHYQQNMACEPAGFISILNSSDPGLLVIPAALAELPSEALEATFDEDAAFVNQLRIGLPAGPARGRAECLRRCGLL
ncbi:hypothetical protein SARC_07165 [Sphaeroforma arctica JP610]|uniref:Cupin type-1 domain-containing protein n=1 Tax=Sphaeroforma arctica JP610 TaxID=667725 RepID=A0A0L0FUE8_9EUKA|nr:hypothetical protein SARC_07165 [Sphaeroforma arctica JP610]KNC80475.1 hypothetical protein SARC_07165 [Sphaeroforma arctica JP610]|eukprot:XP_014154377.1 hypothetical protein SARC_07165 [Sphaeroforma arctica JP610]